MEKSKEIKLTVDARNLECITKALRVINNSIYENNGIVSEYNKNLLESLLGPDWNKKYVFGEIYIN
ncbi:hypothetical protein [Clostridium perfringens]|uniref:hypothetical protein n=1 Tax=Clostridium perfringens TaxID=1502 RepID=UPI001C84C463|nr:hypothetical protein [Clostridium perfringens]